MTARPIPSPTSETLPYWQGGAVAELRYSWCPNCERVLFPPRARCACGADSEWRVSSRRGTIHSFTRVERAPLDSFRDAVPYVIALVDLAEGFRIMVNLRLGEPAIDRAVRIVFEPLGNGLYLPQAEVEDADSGCGRAG